MVTQTPNNNERLTAYAEKQERKIERLRFLAQKYAQESDQCFNDARKMASAIPFGQPILVGHYSEKRDRNYRNRINRRYERSFELSDKAAYYKRRLQAALSNSTIFSDDPLAVQKIKDKIAGLVRAQEAMKAANKVIRKYNPADPQQFVQCLDALMETGYFKNRERVVELLKPDCFGDYGFASYALSNNNANIRRYKARLAELEAKRSMQTTTRMFGEMKVVSNVEANRLQLFFPGKPDVELRTLLKRNGFRWSPTNGCWQAYLNGRAVDFVKNYFKD